MEMKDLMMKRMDKNIGVDISKMSNLDKACFLMVVRKLYRDPLSAFMMDYLPKELKIQDGYQLTFKGMAFLAKAKNNLTTKNVKYEDIFNIINKINGSDNNTDLQEFVKFCTQEKFNVKKGIDNGDIKEQDDDYFLTHKGRYKLLVTKTGLIYTNCMICDCKKQKEQEEKTL